MLVMYTHARTCENTISTLVRPDAHICTGNQIFARMRNPVTQRIVIEPVDTTAVYRLSLRVNMLCSTLPARVILSRICIYIESRFVADTLRKIRYKRHIQYLTTPNDDRGEIAYSMSRRRKRESHLEDFLSVHCDVLHYCWELRARRISLNCNIYMLIHRSAPWKGALYIYFCKVHLYTSETVELIAPAGVTYVTACASRSLDAASPRFETRSTDTNDILQR